MKEAARRPRYRSAGLLQEAQRKLTPYSERTVLKPCGTLSTCTSQDNLSSVESTAMPSFLQRRHIRFSIQCSRGIGEPSVFQSGALPHQTDPLPSFGRSSRPALGMPQLAYGTWLLRRARENYRIPQLKCRLGSGHSKGTRLNKKGPLSPGVNEGASTRGRLGHIH